MGPDEHKSSPLDELAEAVQERGVWAGNLLGQLMPAGIGLRVAAAVLDIGFYFLFSIILSCLTACMGIFGRGGFGEAVGVYIYIVIESLGAVVYLSGEIGTGRTFGKAILKIQVMGINGGGDGRRKRWALRSVPLFMVVGISLLRLLILFMGGREVYRWNRMDEMIAPYALLATLVVMAFCAFITREGRAWYDWVAGTWVARRVRVVRGQGFEPILRG